MAFRLVSWLGLVPETWRADLLRKALVFFTTVGAVVYLPSVFISLKSGMVGVAVLDTVAMGLLFALRAFTWLPERLRAGVCALVIYALGAGLLMTVGSVSQTYLFAFSLLTTLIMSTRWGLWSVALNGLTVLAVGFAGLAAGDMLPARWSPTLGWAVITTNFTMLNLGLVLVLGAVIEALELALARSVKAREALEREQQSLVESKALLKIAGRTARLWGWKLEAGGQQLEWSDEVCDLFELPPGSSPKVDEALSFYPQSDRELMIKAITACTADGTPFDVEATLITAKGTRVWVRNIGHAVRNHANVITAVHGSMQDITAQKTAEARHARLEEQFRQAQKMDTIGRLAGGVAHDFNNLMSVVLTYSELLIDQLAPGDPMRADLEEIRSAGSRAAALTKQLLAFSRQQVLEPRIVDLSDVVTGMEKLLRRLIGEDIEFKASCATNLGKVLVDPGQMEQVIMNLAINARDAMPQGGLLTIETAEVSFDDHYASEHVGVSPGPHVMLAVSDTGTGMSKAEQARMFEPFFTTKEQGKGTGLGLATVFGIVRQSGGTIWVYSEPGAGTAFKMYFPVAEQAQVTTRPSPPPAIDRGTLRGTETILLVEDEEKLRLLAAAILRKFGYTVLEAQNGGEALLWCEQHPAPIDLLLTDVVMPRMSGRQLAERLQPLRPQMKVIYMSGYTDDAVVRHGVLAAAWSFFQKPITPEPLARKVREVLDSQNS